MSFIYRLFGITAVQKRAIGTLICDYAFKVLNFGVRKEKDRFAEYQVHFAKQEMNRTVTINYAPMH